MKRVLTELTPECEITAQMFISGMGKEEIAEAKCRAFSTINNQLQKAFQILDVKNGRQLCKKFYERLSGIEYTFDFSPAMRSAFACLLLCVFGLSLYHEQSDMKRVKRIRIETIERIRRSE